MERTKPKVVIIAGPNGAGKTTAAGRLRVLLFCHWVPSPAFSIQRVTLRVTEGGHHVPSDVIERRYFGGIRNFFNLYRPLATGWRCYNSSIVGRPRLVASGKGAGNARIYDKQTWQEILNRRDQEAGAEADAGH